MNDIAAQDIMVGGRGFWHRAGHTAIGAATCFLFVWWLDNVTIAWLLGCEVVPRILEALDMYAGGFIVTWDQRKRIWQAARDRKFVVPADTINDLWEYRLAWMLYPAALVFF